ncbi:MAG: histidine phosphatase family protein, partial [Bdellovibrionota bacterium]
KRRELMEQGKNESAPAFRARVARFAAWWKRQNLSPLVVACSHGDVLPALIRELTGARAELAKGGWAEITFHVERKFR